jgi:hypothetical protein
MAGTAMSLATSVVGSVIQELISFGADEVAKMLGVRQEVW